MTGALLGIAAVVLVASTGLLVALSLGVKALAELAVATYTICFALVVALALFLSAFDAFTRGGMFAAFVLTLLGAAAAWILRGTPRFPHSRPQLGTPAVVVVLAAVTTVAVAYVLALVVGTPPNGWDPLNYHLARAAFWMQAHHIGYIANAYDQRLNFNPPNAEIAVSTALTLTRNERAAGFVQFFALLACGAGTFALARRLGRSNVEALFGALLLVLAPIVLLQSSGSKNDVVVASFLIAAAVFVVGRTRGQLVLAAVATALAVGAKFTAAYGLVVLLALALVSAPRAVVRRRVLALACGAIAGSYWYVVNAHATGRFLGDQSGTGKLTAPFDPKPNLVTLFGDAVDTLDLSGARGKDILIYAIAAVMVAAAFVLAGSRLRTATAAGAVVAGVLVLLPLAHAGRSGLLHLYDALGKPAGYLAVGDPVTASPTIASDTASWYGPTGLLLVIGTIVIATLRYRRRALPAGALVAAYAPAAWLALAAVTLTYHPWQGRFFVFPLAMSAALWGLALEVRPLAWSLVVIAGVTAALSLVHYAEKPSGVRLIAAADEKSVWQMSRWEVQSTHDPALAPLWRYLDQQVPAHARLALAFGPNDFGFPAFGAHLGRTIVLVPGGSSARNTAAGWLLANAQRAGEIDPACWTPRLRAERGTVFQAKPGCG
ncbi:MAG TPA: hypothetical protein VLB89_06705 [Gaiellaceae bacterium]|nr:hypothetical protein [Gaiellaceae bacterium]